MVVEATRDAFRSRPVVWLLALVAGLVPVGVLAGVAGATCATTTALCTATTTAKTTTLKYIGVALVGIVVVLALMIGIHVLIRLFKRASK